MKILIAFDGSHPIENVIGDLKRAGLPKNVEAIVLTAANVMLPAAANFADVPIPSSGLAYIESTKTLSEEEIRKAKSTADQASQALQKAFPHWHVKSESSTISPSWGIITKAENWNADLVVVGSHEATQLTKVIFGSIAHKVLIEVPCSVRVVHRAPEETDSPVRIVIGVDGSPGCELAVNEVAKRDWKKGSAVHLIAVIDSSLATAVIASSPVAGKWVKKTDVNTRLWVERMVKDFGEKLKRAGLTVTSLIKEGKPGHVLVQESEQWGADCIFVGARGLNMIERFLIGSVSTAVASRSHCSVEVVRRKKSA